jgi:hypothetical protein
MLGKIERKVVDGGGEKDGKKTFNEAGIYGPTNANNAQNKSLCCTVT